MLVLPVPMRRTAGRRYVESQAVNGLLRWADNFELVTAALVCYPEDVAANIAGVRWECIEDREDLRRVAIVELPYGYAPRVHHRVSAGVRELLAPLIDQSRYLCFAIGGFFGDWGSTAALISAQKRRKFAVWTDRVESQVIRSDAAKKRGVLKRLYGTAYAWWVGRFEAHVIRKAALGLFHGRDTFDAYRSLLPSSFQVENIHLHPSDRIQTKELLEKKARLSQEGRAHLVHDIHLSESDRIPQRIALEKSFSRAHEEHMFKIGYAGRAADMKAPLQWLEVIRILAAGGFPIRATWLGDGPLLGEMKAYVLKHGLGGIVELPGFVGDRTELVAQLRTWDVLLFTHITPESPRILLEAMVSATPIVGYDSPFARDLVAGFGEPFLTPVGVPAQLADVLGRLLVEPGQLRRLILNTWEQSGDFNDVAVFRHRSQLIKSILTQK
ncbi:MAG: glycosyltransferase [Betaproteobacteria bacterium]